MAAYITGYNNTMDVAGFGFNTQSAMFYQSLHAQHDVHNGVICDSCGANPLRGIRWRCQTCPDHDICGECKNRGAGVGHRFNMMSVGQTNDAVSGMGQEFQASQEAGVHWTSCKGCQVYPIRGTLYACTVCPGFNMVSPHRQLYKDNLTDTCKSAKTATAPASPHKPTNIASTSSTVRELATLHQHHKASTHHKSTRIRATIKAEAPSSNLLRTKPPTTPSRRKCCIRALSTKNSSMGTMIIVSLVSSMV